MDFVVRMDVWNKLSPKMKEWLDDEIQVYSNIHHAAIQKADMEAWGKFEKAGVQINRLPAEDLPKFQRVAVPIWFKWANKDPDAAKIFKLQLDIMESHELRLRDAGHVQGPEDRRLTALVAGPSAAGPSTRARRPRGGVRLSRGSQRCRRSRSSCRTGCTGAPCSSSRSSRCTWSRGSAALGAPREPILFNAYLFWLTSGFMGLHRMYLKSWWGFVYVPFFVAVLYCNGEVRDSSRGRLAHHGRARAGSARRQGGRADRRGRADAGGTPGGRRCAGRPCAKHQAEYDAAARGPEPLEEHCRLARGRRRGDAARRRGLAAGPGAAAPRADAAAAGYAADPVTHEPEVPSQGTAEDPTMPHAHAVHRLRSTASTPRPASTSPTGRVHRGVRLLLRGDRRASSSIRRPTGCTRACS